MTDEQRDTARDTKEALKEALKEWLDEKFAQFGKWTAGGLAAAAMFLLVNAYLATHGWKLP